MASRRHADHVDTITVKFVHGDAELIRDIEVDAADDPPLTYSIWLPENHSPARESEPEEPWEAVYVREPNPSGDPQWIYRYHGVIDPEM